MDERMQDDIDSMGLKIIEMARKGVSEQSVAMYVMGVDLSSYSTEKLFEKIIREGFAEAAIRINNEIRVLRPSPEIFSNGMPNIMKRARNGYSEETVGKFVLLSGIQQDLYDTIVEHGFVEAVRVVFEQNPKVLPSNSDIPYLGLARVCARVRDGYVPQIMADFVQMTGLPSKLTNRK